MKRTQIEQAVEAFNSLSVDDVNMLKKWEGMIFTSTRNLPSRISNTWSDFRYTEFGRLISNRLTDSIKAHSQLVYCDAFGEAESNRVRWVEALDASSPFCFAYTSLKRELSEIDMITEDFHLNRIDMENEYEMELLLKMRSFVGCILDLNRANPEVLPIVDVLINIGICDTTENYRQFNTPVLNVNRKFGKAEILLRYIQISRLAERDSEVEFELYKKSLDLGTTLSELEHTASTLVIQNMAKVILIYTLNKSVKDNELIADINRNMDEWIKTIDSTIDTILDLLKRLCE